MTAMLAPARDDHFDRLRRLVEETTGNRMPDSKRQMIESRLAKRVTALGMPSFVAYLRALYEGGKLDAEMPRIIDLLTTHKTDFWREPVHFHQLEHMILPELLRLHGPGRARLKLWSAACSTGAEAWSAAMLLWKRTLATGQFDFAILGTDIAPGVIETARRAVYPAELLDPVPAELRNKATLLGRDRTGGGALRIVPELRQRARFAELNLIEPPYPLHRDFDVIFIRNVLIYFEPPTQARVIAALADHLRPGGYLLPGHSESMVVRHPHLTQIAPAVFRKEMTA